VNACAQVRAMMITSQGHAAETMPEHGRLSMGMISAQLHPYHDFRSSVLLAPCLVYPRHGAGGLDASSPRTAYLDPELRAGMRAPRL
jgi:hypothetical protein